MGAAGLAVEITASCQSLNKAAMLFLELVKVRLM